jgi:hypothetical protein
LEAAIREFIAARNCRPNQQSACSGVSDAGMDNNREVRVNQSRLQLARIERNY